MSEARASRRLEAWCVAQAKKTWRQGKCLWDLIDHARDEDERFERRRELRKIGKMVQEGM